MNELFEASGSVGASNLLNLLSQNPLVPLLAAGGFFFVVILGAGLFFLLLYRVMKATFWFAVKAAVALVVFLVVIAVGLGLLIALTSGVFL